MNQSESASSADDGPSRVPPPEVPSPAAGDLPVDEPLTPEILEDEAIRGDFVLRWVVVAVAFLFGCAQLQDATPLVHVRAGEWLAAHGFLPTGEDPFSLLTAGRRWLQLDWLFDLLAYAIHAAIGPIGLSLAAGLVAAVTFALIVQSHRREVRTWWTAVCGALALLACSNHFDFGPSLWTLFGVAVVLAILVASENKFRAGLLWCVVPVMLVWSQMSSQAWIGAAIIVLYWAGAVLDPPRIIDQQWIAVQPHVLQFPMLVSILVMLIHPFTWHTLEAAWTQYAVEYPAYRFLYPRPVPMDLVWYPLWSPLVWQTISVQLVVGIALAITAGLCLLLNGRRVSWAHGMLYLGGNALGIAALHDLPIASVINAILAGLHAQDWYHNRYGQVYTVAWAEVAFSRGGRAVTLLAFFALAWAIISGRIDGPDGRRTGVGLARNLQIELETYGKLKAITQDERGFHTTVRQGDFLIAAGRKSLVDRRVVLFSGVGDQNLLAWFERYRKGFLPPTNPDEARDCVELQREVMTQHKLSHVVLRLIQLRDEAALSALLSDGAWSLTEILPSAAVLHRMNPSDPSRQTFITQNRFSPVQSAFRPVSPTLDDAPPRPLMPTWSQNLMSAPRNQRSSETALAAHYLQLGRVARRAPWPFQAGCYHMAVRAARGGIREDGLQAEPYLILGQAYVHLSQLEAMALAQNQIPWNRSLRYYQAVASLRQAVRLQPDSVEAWSLLFELYRQAGVVDAALTALREVLQATPEKPGDDEQAVRQREAMLDLDVHLDGTVAKIRRDIYEMRQKNTPEPDLVAYAHDNGCDEMAIEMLRNNQMELERNPVMRQLLTLCLADVGEGESLDDSAQRLEALSQQLPSWSWRTPVALAAVGRGDYDTALRVWEELPRTVTQMSLQSLLESTAISTTTPFVSGNVPFPMVHLNAAQQGFGLLSYQSFDASFHSACCEMERGNTAAAVGALRGALQQIPDTPLRPLLRLYLFCLTDELIDLEPPTDWIPQPADLFTPEASNP